MYRVDYKPGVKLYVKRVFITDDDKELLPTYLRFVRGVIDSAEQGDEKSDIRKNREWLQMKKKDTWGPVIHTLRKAVQKRSLPSVFRVVISPRTKDEVTLKAAERLFTKAPDLQQLAGLTEKEIQSLIHPAGFYKKKAKHLKQIARILIDNYDSRIPDGQAALLSLPGAGRYFHFTITFAIQPEVKKTTRLVTILVEARWKSKQAIAKANRQVSLSLCSWRELFCRKVFPESYCKPIQIDDTITSEQ